MSDTTNVDVSGRRVRITSPDRVLWPRTGFTKREMIAYDLRVAEVLLPHLVDRPVTLHRFPEGVEGPHFYQTRCPPHPPWVRTQRMYTFRRSGKIVDAAVIDDAAALVWAANLSSIELHPYLSTAEDLDAPTDLVFDLDPGPPAGIREACRVALGVRSLLAEVGLRSRPKVSGRLGVHVHVRLHGPHTYADTKRVARAVADGVAELAPELVVGRIDQALRTGRVYVDWSQNDAGKSTVAPYSLRGTPVPLVAAPVTWDEVQQTADGRDPRRLRFGPVEVLQRLDDFGDPFEASRTFAQALTGTPVVEGATGDQAGAVGRAGRRAARAAVSASARPDAGATRAGRVRTYGSQ